MLTVVEEGGRVLGTIKQGLSDQIYIWQVIKARTSEMSWPLIIQFILLLFSYFKNTIQQVQIKAAELTSKTVSEARSVFSFES